MTATELLRWLAETSLAISVLILLVLLIRKPFAKAFGARAAYALWLAPAVRLFMPELKLLPAPAQPVADVAPVAAITPDTVWHTQGWEAQATQVFETASANFDWFSLTAAAALVLWATIAFAWFSLKLETQGKYLRQRMNDSTPASPALMSMAQTIARDFNLRRTPAVRISNDNESGPCLIGLLRPVVFLPSGFESDYAQAEQRLVLAHEIAHVARGDMAATFVALSLQAAQWPNPLAHISFAAFRTDQESACDAFVMARCASVRGAAGNYASAILKSVRTQTDAPAFGLALAHPVKERLMLLKSQKKSPLRLAAGVISAAAFTAVSLAATASYGFADAPKAQATKETKKKSYSRTIISVDDGERLEVPGYADATMIDVEKTKDGVRTVRVYGKDRKLLNESTYGPAQTLPFEEVVVIGKDGKRETKNFVRPEKVELVMPAHPAMPAHPVDGVPPIPAIAGEQRIIMIERDDDSDHDFHMAHCGDGEGHDPVVMEWSTEETGAEGHADGKVASYEVVCMTEDADADPATRVERLRARIARMEAAAKRDAERRKEMIARMREELKEAEKRK
ncbi:M56 family metallopeptidase [Hyphococcus sp.]|uniref:M56 family metallopeptidase n=1 Tax=Hyphococcus sp. TaxID=2038636 RepID=UPI00208B9CAC|nr:MAG: hypothetical protein DHS20C04_14520 [Marinicaulis sp.]